MELIVKVDVPDVFFDKIQQAVNTGVAQALAGFTLPSAPVVDDVIPKEKVTLDDLRALVRGYIEVPGKDGAERKKRVIALLNDCDANSLTTLDKKFYGIVKEKLEVLNG